MRRMSFRVLPLCAAIAIAPASVVAAGPTLALEEVIVSAQKREESIQDVPISIVAFTVDTLEKMGVKDVKGLAAKIPNVVINEFTGGATTLRLYIRGVGQNDVQVTQDPSVALYMDGVYIGSSVGTAFETADIQRIEVLRGPQGTLYGRNATGGAIQLITNRADPSGIRIEQRLTGGNLDQFISRSIANLPITDTTAVKFAYAYSERDALTDNEGNGEDFGKEKRDNFTGDFHWDARDTQTLDYKYEYSTVEDTSRLSQILDFNNNAPQAFIVGFANPALNAQGGPIEVTDDRLDSATSFDPQETGKVTINAHTLNYEWEISDLLSFRSITGYRDVDTYNQTSQAPTAYLTLGGDRYSITNGIGDTRFKQFSQELQLLGDSDTLTWVGGLFYYTDESEDNQLGDSFGSEPINSQIIDYTKTDNSSVAAFGQATWTPESLERWHFTLGARYSDDDRKVSRENNRVSYSFGGTPTGIPAFNAEYDKNFGEFNPTAVVEYDLTDFSNVYAKITTAYKAGGTSQRSQVVQNFEEGFEPEDLVSYELGYKGDLLDGRWRLNGALFHMQYDDYQQSVQTGQSPAARDFVNIDEAEISGFELDSSLAITERLVGTFSYGYLDTSFGPDSISYLRLDSSSPTGAVLVEEALTESLALAPENSATISLDYTLPLSFGTLNANINAQYQDKTNSGVQEPSGIQDDRTLVNATIGIWDIELGRGAGRFRAMLWGNNLFDEEYYLSNVRLEPFAAIGIGEIATFGDPRTYGVTLQYQYN